MIFSGGIWAAHPQHACPNTEAFPPQRIKQHNILLVALAQARPYHRSWLTAIFADFQWFAANTSELSSYTSFNDHDWIQWAFGAPQQLKERILKASSDCHANMRDNWALHASERNDGTLHSYPYCQLVFR